MKRIALAFLLATAMGCGGSEDPVIPPPPPPAGECNLDTQAGCAEGEKCTWIRQVVGEEPVGIKGCVAEGTAASGEDCVWGVAGSETGYDNCAAGLICSSSSRVDQAEGTCVEICSLDGVTLACPTGFSCSQYYGYFANPGGTAPAHGQCNPSCDPLTNNSYNAETQAYDTPNCGGDVYPDVYPEGHVDENGNPDAGEPVPEAGLPYESCVISWSRQGSGPSEASCASNLRPLWGHREPATIEEEDIFLNMCPPGTILANATTALPPATPPATCLALCRPAPTYIGNSAQGRGIAPDSCDDAFPWNEGGAGRAANESSAECLYGWIFENADNRGNSELSNTVGICFSQLAYPDPEDGSFGLRCDEVTDEPDPQNNNIPEYIAYGCGPYPQSLTAPQKQSLDDAAARMLRRITLSGPAPRR